MTNTTQPGTEVGGDLWQQFRDEVEARHGVVRGNLKDALETAIQAYIDGEDMSPTEVNRRLARIEAAVGVNATDGGTDTSQPPADTHTRDWVQQIPDERPHPRGDTKTKVRWLAAAALDAHGVALDDLKVIHEDTIREAIGDEYDFNPDTAEDYVSKVVDQLGLVDHPSADPYADVLYVTEAKREELIDAQREESRDDVRDKLDDL